MTLPAGKWNPTATPQGYWVSDGLPTTDAQAFQQQFANPRQAVTVVQTPEGYALARGGVVSFGGAAPPGSMSVVGYVPAFHPEQLGDASFRRDHGLKYAYMTGAMANGIASAEIVEAVGRAGMLGSFGAAGLSVERIEKNLDRLQNGLAQTPFCINLIHSPGEPAHEMATAELFLRRGIRHVEASAYLDLTPAVVRYRVAGFDESSGLPRNRLIAKVSRVEVARKFLAPPPERLVRELVTAGHVSPRQAELASRFPVANDLTVEADSGGHTDNRPAITLLPTMLALRDSIQSQFRYAQPPRVGLAGGIATPASVAGAFAMGAGYVVTGSINQACVESGSSAIVRKMLAEAGQADVTMAPAADMFEMGVRVQVLKRGTMFPMRAAKLYELYRQHASWEAIPSPERVQVEKTLLKTSFEQVWAETAEFFRRRDPGQLARAETDPKHKMALVFRWYLGLSSRWANAGEPDRQLDYQVWCGPAMGAFNEWVKGTVLDPPANRTVVGVGLNLLYGACVVLRRQSLRQQGVELPDDCFPLAPVPREELELLLS